MFSNNIKDLRSPSSNCAIIPEELKKHRDFRYLKIKKKEKKPSENFWTNNNLEEAIIDWRARKIAWENNGKKGTLPRKPNRLTNYLATDPSLVLHLEGGGNYGVAAGHGGLAPFDSDEENRLQELGVFDKLPPTFRVRTGSSGFHRYFFIPDLDGKIILFDKVLKNPKQPTKAMHLGEIQWRGSQVVGPGSTHPNGKKYEVIDDLPIATITKAQLLDAISCCNFKENNGATIHCAADEKRPKSSKSRRVSSFGESISIQNIAMPDNPRSRSGKNGLEIFGAHPLHGSGTRKNFHINIDKNIWYCHRCRAGGGPLEWLAVKEGIIDCSDAGPGCLKGKKYRQTINAARKLGYTIPEPRKSGSQVNVIENRILCETLPEDLPTESNEIVEGPPRIGKTRWGVNQMKKAGSGNYITHSHPIAAHAVRIFEELGGVSAVHLEGKARPGMCRKQGTNCTECELCPNEHNDSHIGYIELERRASNLLHEHKILTKERIPNDLCPYYTLKLAEKYARFCFTVPHFIEEIEPRQLTVLDEDPTLSYFFPPSPVLFRYKKEKNEIKFDNVLGKALEQSQGIARKSNTSKEEAALELAIDALENINETIKLTMSGECTPEKCYEKIEDQLKKTEVNYDDQTIEKALRRLGNYHMDHSCEVDLRDYIRCWFYRYERKPMHLLSSGRSGYKSVHLVGDARTPVLNMKWASDAKMAGRKILIIGNTISELFGKALGDAVVIEIQQFKYANNYIVIPMDSGGEDKAAGEIKKQRLKIKELIKKVSGKPDNEKRCPVMVLTGSKEHQERLVRSIGGLAHASQDEGELGQKWNYLAGNVNVFYQNSTISRGLDVDQYHVMLVHDADFAQPSWSAAKEAGEDNADVILDSIVMDETTNSVLRISPVVGGDELRPKVVVIPRNDLWKVRYLDAQIFGGSQGGRSPDIEDIANTILKHDLAGHSKLGITGISNSSSIGEEWHQAVVEGRLLDLFRVKLGDVRSEGSFTGQEVDDACVKIIETLKKAGKDKWLSVKQMKSRGFRCKNVLIRIAIAKLIYVVKIEKERRSRTYYYRLRL